MKKNVKPLLFFILIVIPVILHGQNIDFRNPQLPLSDNNVQVIIEDYKGFMWFATESGLNRFDGLNMNVYGKKFGDSTSLSNNKVLSLYETKDKKLWIGTSSGLNLYNRNEDKFVNYYFEQSIENSSGFNVINDIVEDADGDLWLATQEGTCIFDRKKNTFIQFSKFTKSKQSIEDVFINSLVIDKKGRAIAGTDKSKIFVYDKKAGKITEHFLDNGGSDIINIREIRKVSITKNGTIWISTAGTGLFKINKIEKSHIWYEKYLHNPDDDLSISTNDINSVCEYNKNELLIGTINGGLNILNYSTNSFKRFQKSSTTINSIGGNSIWSIYKDKKNRVWIGIFNVGVNVIDSLPPKFKSLKHNSLNTNSLTHSSITSFLEDENGNMWITADGGGLDYWNRSTNEFTHFRHKADDSTSLLSNAGLCLYKTDKGEIWIGCYAGGINILNNDKKTFRHLTTKNGLNSNNIFSITGDNTGKIYIATFGGGLNIYNTSTKEITTHTHEVSDKLSLANNNINILYIDSKGKLWIGFNNGGLDLMIKNNDETVSFKHYKNNPKDINSLSDNTVLAIIEDKNGNIWLGTRDGLSMLNLKTNEFTIYRSSDGLPSNTVVGIIEDEAGNLWLSTLNGLSMFNIETKTFKNYTESDGLQGQKFNNRASYYKNSSGEFFFGGNKGFSTFHPAKIKYDRSFPNLYIVDFKLFNKNVAIGKENSPLKKHISETSELTLTYEQSVFSLEYVALNFKDPKKIQYAYMLEGLENDWNYVGTKRTATYTNLDAGEYIFKVKSTNLEGDWNEKATTIKIIILPPWWATWWFRTLIITILIIGITLFIRTRTQQLQKSKQELEAKVKEATDEVKNRNSKLSEAQTKLTSIINEVKNQLGKASEDLLDATNSQASSIEEISASMEQMANNINENAAGASKMLINAKNIEKDAKASVEIVSKTLNSIEDITEGIGFISDFARLTNLLSLNAAVEAARAGVHGKSFTVVAKQVKKLADQSKDVAVNITKLSETGLNLSHKANTKINELQEYIKNTVVLIDKINESSQSQSREANNINLTIQQISNHITSTTQLAEKLDAAINSLTIDG